LAKLPRVEYEQQRRARAKQVGIRVDALDEQVKVRRAQAGGTSSAEELPHWRVEPRHEAVDGAVLLNELAAVFARHVVLPKHGTTALALWVLHTWCLEATDTSPYLLLKSPEMRCGKTRVLTILFFVTPRSELASNLSPAAVYRYVEDARPTLLVDEADSFVRGNDEIRGILNSGHTRASANVMRCVPVGDGYKWRRFSTWAAKAIASIGGLADTLHDRSVILPMQRKRLEQRVERLRSRDNAEFAELRSMAARWAQDNMAALSAADASTNVPAELNDRAADNWRPLVGIADLAGGDWPNRAREAALALSGTEEPNSLGVQLLADIKAAFGPDEDAVTTRTLLDRLTADPERPWLDYRHGKPLSPKQLGRRLALFGIRSETLGGVAKGYRRARFEETWARYLASQDGTGQGPDGRDGPVEMLFSPDPGVSEASKRPSADEMGTNAHFSKRPEGVSGRIEKVKEMPVPRGFGRLDGLKAGGAGEKGLAGAGNGSAAPGRHACSHCGQADGRVQEVGIDGQTCWLHLECEDPFVAALDAASSGVAVGQDVGNAATRQSSAGAAPGNGAQRAAPACQYCGKADPPLREFQTVEDGGVVGSVTLHPTCKDAWVRDLWAAHRARQAATAPDCGGGQ
jgi:hypothetical protein